MTDISKFNGFEVISEADVNGWTKLAAEKTLVNIEYRKAAVEEAGVICDIVQDTKAVIYPHYYTQAVVDFFGRLHSIDNIRKDIEEGKIDVLIVDGKIIGTGSHVL